METGGPQGPPVSVYVPRMWTRIKLLLFYLGYWLAFFLALRLVFLVFHSAQTALLSLPALAGIFWHGLGLDLASVAYLSLIPFVLIALSAVGGATRWLTRIVLGFTILATATLSLLAAADLEIFRSWGRRIDASVLIYLAFPREIWAAAGGGSPWLLLTVFTLLTAGFTFLAWRLLRPRLLALPAVHSAATLPLLFAAALLVIPGRGGIQQIPINQSSAYFSTEPFANKAALNVGWNFFDSWVRGLDRRDNPFVAMPADSATALIERDFEAASAPPNAPLLRKQAGSRPNLLLIVWESFTARSVASLGGLPGATPEFERLAQSGLLFRRFYAAGDRTEKGLAALLAGAPTVPGASISMVPSKTETLPVLSRRLATAGYSTAFYYGGELGFANLKSFVLHGRFERILGEEDFSGATLTSKWGAHDEVVAERLFADLAGTRQPFFVTWLTQSSHEPFDVPGSVRVPGEDGESRFLNSLAYTDHVIGELLRRMERERWWDSTLVVIVADHSKKLERTDAAVPYKSAAAWYHIPMLWTGGALARTGEVLDALGSQTDLAPTLLGVLGLSGGEQYQFGRDLFGGRPRSWAYYGFDDGFGLVTPSGSLVWENIPNQITSRSGRIGRTELQIGKAFLQLTYQDYLDR